MTKDEVGRVLQNIARLLELKGENPFKIRAYVNAARALEEALPHAERLPAGTPNRVPADGACGAWCPMQARR